MVAQFDMVAQCNMVAQCDIYPQNYLMKFRCNSRIICKDWKIFQIRKICSTEQSRKSGEIMRLMDLLLIYVCLTSPSPDSSLQRQALLVICGRMT
jgi:hypothetical protein